MKLKLTPRDFKELGETGNVSISAAGLPCIVEVEPESQLVRRHGVPVYADLEMDELRRWRCLCFRCGRDMSLCPTAQELFKICKDKNIALAVTRCQKWIPEE